MCVCVRTCVRVLNSAYQKHRKTQQFVGIRVRAGRAYHKLVARHEHDNDNDNDDYDVYSAAACAAYR